MPNTADPPKSREATVMHRSLSGAIQRVRADGEPEAGGEVYRYEFKASSDASVEM